MLKGACTMKIRLSEDVKLIVQRLVEETGKQGLKQADTLLLFQILMEENSDFKNSINYSSELSPEEINETVVIAREDMGVCESKLRIPKEKTYFGSFCMKDAEIPEEEKRKKPGRPRERMLPPPARFLSCLSAEILFPAPVYWIPVTG